MTLFLASFCLAFENHCYYKREMFKNIGKKLFSHSLARLSSSREFGKTGLRKSERSLGLVVMTCP